MLIDLDDMVICMGVATGAISAGSAIFRRQSSAGKCRNDHGSHLAPRFLRRRSLLGEKQYLPLSKWVQVFYLAADATTGIYSLFLIRDPPEQLQLHCKLPTPPEA